MIRFASQRAAALAPLLLIASFLVFLSAHLAPGGPEAAFLTGRPVSEVTRQAFRAYYHLNDPLPLQFLRWLGDLVHGNFGQSISYRNDVSAVILARLPTTLLLATMAAFLIFVLGTGLGVCAAVLRGTYADAAISSLAVAAAAVPSFVTGIVLILIFALDLGWFPVFGSGIDEGFLTALYHLLLPSLALAFSGIAMIMRITRSAMVRELTSDYVETARARGLGHRRLLVHHALRNALVPIVSVQGVIVGYLIGGAVLIEYTFGLDGIGSLLIHSIQTRDIAVVQAVSMLLVTVFVAVNLIVDLLTFVIDPRIRRDVT